VPGATGCGVVGRERTGGGGGPDEPPGGVRGWVTGVRTGGGGGPPDVEGEDGERTSTRGAVGEMPGNVSRGAWGGIEEAGRGGENDGRGGTADDGSAGGLGPRSPWLSFSLMLRALATISKT
jgi:hypothetical protein